MSQNSENILTISSSPVQKSKDSEQPGPLEDGGLCFKNDVND